MILVQRYMFRQILGPFVTAVTAFAGLALLTQSLSNIDLVSNYRETALIFVKVTALALPHLTALLLPFALFVATLISLNRLSGDSEIVVASSSGLSRWGVLAPLMRLAVYAVIANLALNLFVQPMAYREMRRSLHELRTDVAASLVRPGAFSRLGPGVTLYARDTQPGGRMLGVFINDSRATDASATYVAREGVVVRAETRPAMVLVDGSLQQLDADGTLNFLEFERYEFDLSDFVDPTEALFFKDSDKFLYELFNPEAAAVARTRGAERLLAEAHYRLSAPIYNITLMLIAAAAFLAGQHSRLGYVRRVLIAIGVALMVRLAGFAVQSAAADQPSLNALQYALPAGAGLIALWLILGVGRRSRILPWRRGRPPAAKAAP
ncbi:MAG: LptF/LptG family permease [Maricaulaceae bacterium]|nr:LptF/LptG family permease [Maricaulaceae bacterium]